MRITTKILYLILASTNISLAYNWAIWPGTQESQSTTIPLIPQEEISSLPQLPSSKQRNFTPSPSLHNSVGPTLQNGLMNQIPLPNTYLQQPSTLPHPSLQQQQINSQQPLESLGQASLTNPPSSSLNSNRSNQADTMQFHNPKQYTSGPTISQQNPPSINQTQFSQQNAQQQGQSSPSLPALTPQLALTGLAALTALGNKGKGDTSSRGEQRENAPTMSFSRVATKIVSKNFKCTKSEATCQQEWDTLVQSIENNPQFQVIKKQLKCDSGANSTNSEQTTNE